MNKILDDLKIDYLLVNSTNDYLVEYSLLEENSRYKLTGFSGSTGDALLTKDKIYLFVDGRYHTQADNEVYDNITVVKLQLGQKQDDEIRKLIGKDKVLGVVSKKVSQARLEMFEEYNVKLLTNDPINDYLKDYNTDFVQALPIVDFKPQRPMFISNLEEVSYLTGLRNFSMECSSKIWAKLFVDESGMKLFRTNLEAEKFLKSFDKELQVDKNTINVYDYSLIKHPVHKISPIKEMKSIKTNLEIEEYKKAFEATDKAVMSIRKFINEKERLSEYEIATQLKTEFLMTGAKSLSFNSIVAINKNSALAHYSKNSKDVFLEEGDIVLIDCGAYYKSGLATDITRVFVKGEPNDLQKNVYTMVLKAFLNAYNVNLQTGYEMDKLVHSILDNSIEGFIFNHGLGHGIGINVHETPPMLSQGENAKSEIKDNMTFTIEPGLYNPQCFGIRLENSCYKKDGKIYSFVKMGYEGKLIDWSLLSEQEQNWLKEFEIL